MPARNRRKWRCPRCGRCFLHDPGQGADVATLERLFHASAVTFGGHHEGGQPVLVRTALPILSSRVGRSERRAFTNARRNARSRPATASRSPTASNRGVTVPPREPASSAATASSCARQARWKILSLYYHFEKPGAADVARTEGHETMHRMTRAGRELPSQLRLAPTSADALAWTAWRVVVDRAEEGQSADADGRLLSYAERS